MRSPSIIHFVIVVVSNTCGDNNEEVFREAIVHLWSLIMHFVVEILISLINKCYSRFYSNDWKIISISLQVHSTFLHPPVCLRVQLSITYVCNSLQYVFLLVLSEQVTGKKKLESTAEWGSDFLHEVESHVSLNWRFQHLVSVSQAS